MPELDIQRRPATGIPAWVWLLVALLVIGLIWWMVARTGREQVAQAPAADGQVAGTREETVGTTDYGALPVAAILAEPNAHVGQTVSGVVEIDEIVGQRGFWAEEAGQRIFVAMDAAAPPPALTAGQRVTVRGTVADPQQMEQVPAVTELPQETREMLRTQPAFIRATEVEGMPA